MAIAYLFDVVAEKKSQWYKKLFEFPLVLYVSWFNSTLIELLVLFLLEVVCWTLLNIDISLNITLVLHFIF